MPQVGSFNYDVNKMIFRDEFIADEKQIRSVLDYFIEINPLSERHQRYEALTGELGLKYNARCVDLIDTGNNGGYVICIYSIYIYMYMICYYGTRQLMALEWSRPAKLGLMLLAQLYDRGNFASWREERCRSCMAAITHVALTLPNPTIRCWPAAVTSRSPNIRKKGYANRNING